MIADESGAEIREDWMLWFLGLPDEQKSALEAYWAETANLPGLQRGHRHAGYARRKVLIEHSLGLGYEPKDAF